MNTNEATFWNACSECFGQGKKKLRLRKKVRLQNQNAVEQKSETENIKAAPIVACSNCKGTGIQSSSKPPEANTTLPFVAIIGGGIGGMALAVALSHRGIPFALFERDETFNARAQGYGLTLQQASKAMQALGIVSLQKGVVSTRHLVHSTAGEVLAEWGMRKWVTEIKETYHKRSNVHIARQELRQELYNQIVKSETVTWGHQLLDYYTDANHKIHLRFKANGQTQHRIADMVVGADGIRSTLRNLLIKPKSKPLRYLGCMVILGICKLDSLSNLKSDLLDGATVFQTSNGHDRLYLMPFTTTSVMWQLSFPIPEEEAKTLSQLGQQALHTEAQRKTPWHHPIPEIMVATPIQNISGYPAYDRELLTPEDLQNAGPVTLLGDAAHPMSPFKGQGANQAILDALSLARTITRASNWRTIGIRKAILENYETEMITRSASKVTDSAAAAQFLHTQAVLHPANEPRGTQLKQINN